MDKQVCLENLQEIISTKDKNIDPEQMDFNKLENFLHEIGDDLFLMAPVYSTGSKFIHMLWNYLNLKEEIKSTFSEEVFSKWQLFQKSPQEVTAEIPCGPEKVEMIVDKTEKEPEPRQARAEHTQSAPTESSAVDAPGSETTEEPSWEAVIQGIPESLGFDSTGKDVSEEPANEITAVRKSQKACEEKPPVSEPRLTEKTDEAASRPARTEARTSEEAPVRKVSVEKPVLKTTSVKRTAAKKPATKKPAAKKVVAEKIVPEKVVPEKAVAEEPAATKQSSVALGSEISKQEKKRQTPINSLKKDLDDLIQGFKALEKRLEQMVKKIGTSNA